MSDRLMIPASTMGAASRSWMPAAWVTA
jgi:hypothetical protein